MADIPPPSMSTTVFRLSASKISSAGIRRGRFTLERSSGSVIEVDTPGIITATSRGVVPHLSRDHARGSAAIRWVNIPFESFLDHDPPVPTLQSGTHPLHTFLGFSPTQHILTMSARDPFDSREMPPNGKDNISAYCNRGVRKLSTDAWSTYLQACNPDLVLALSDTPFTPPPHSQKRLTKSIERSAAWLMHLLAQRKDKNLPKVLVHMAGGAIEKARGAFAQNLVETLYGHQQAQIESLKTLDEGIFGYVFDLVPLRISLLADVTGENPLTGTNTAVTRNSPYPSNGTEEIARLLHASLDPLPPQKIRIVNSAASPHEMLRLIRDVGIDMFDAHWAQRAADIGVALDFHFPPGKHPDNHSQTTSGRLDLGHNLYDTVYAHDHSCLGRSDEQHPCPCTACSPRRPTACIAHSSLDTKSLPEMSSPQQPFTRAYVHHLLHTHEMSAHSLLVMHNLAELDAFFAGIREILAQDDAMSVFPEAVEKFEEMYDEGMAVFVTARMAWEEVDKARGKGRLARERVKQTEADLGTTNAEL